MTKTCSTRLGPADLAICFDAGRKLFTRFIQFLQKFHSLVSSETWLNTPSVFYHHHPILYKSHRLGTDLFSESYKASADWKDHANHWINYGQVLSFAAKILAKFKCNLHIHLEKLRGMSRSLNPWPTTSEITGWITWPLRLYTRHGQC